MNKKTFCRRFAQMIADKKHWAANEEATSNWQIAISQGETSSAFRFG
jgi:hypothetical protein